jgi:hypothetical protein
LRIADSESPASAQTTRRIEPTRAAQWAAELLAADTAGSMSASRHNGSR